MAAPDDRPAGVTPAAQAFELVGRDDVFVGDDALIGFPVPDALLLALRMRSRQVRCRCSRLRQASRWASTEASGGTGMDSRTAASATAGRKAFSKRAIAVRASCSSRFELAIWPAMSPSSRVALMTAASFETSVNRPVGFDIAAISPSFSSASAMALSHSPPHRIARRGD